MEALLRQMMRGTATRLCLVVWLFGYVLVDLIAAAQGRSLPGVMLLASVPLLVVGVAQSVALGGLLDRMSDGAALVRWPVVAIAGLGAALIQTIAEHYWLALLAVTVFPDWQAWALSEEPSRKFTILILYLWTLYLTVALMWASRAGDRAKMNEARAAAFAAAAARAEAAALRLQLNPHFLFNTLNGIASLVVRHRGEQAEEMIGRLADFLRFSLASDPTAQVPLAQEIETARAYLTIEEARFGPRLRVEVEVDPRLRDVEVPNFILQPLIENAIQHGVAPRREKVTVAILAGAVPGGTMLSVVNRAAGGEAAPPPDPARAPRHGIGLANTRARLQAQYGETAVLDCRALCDGYRVDIRLPEAAASGAWA